MIFNKLKTDESVILDLIKANINSNNRFLVTYLNQNCFNVYTENIFYKNLLDYNFTIYADGFGVSLVLRFFFGKKYKNFNATDLNEKIVEFLITQKIKFFIIGGNFSKNELNNKFGMIDCFVGYNSGYFLENEFDEIANKISLLKPDVIVLGMGVPKQEIIAEKLSQYINASIFLCVGNFFEFYLGTIKRIPKKYRNIGIEWIYRFFQEPKRLWKRYFIGIPLFIFRVIKLKLSINKSVSEV
jgi:N-acetylglucosaminyldiphosphoundecaprenol N-acetyl-beta-D-mannosaminyltransferase